MTDESPMPDDKLYTVHGPSRITLSAEARELAKMHGMSDEQMARHLLDRRRLAQAGLIQADPKDTV